MAFQSETSLHKCCLCKEEHKWHKMMYSENPAARKWEADDPSGAAGSSDGGIKTTAYTSHVLDVMVPLGGWKQLKCCSLCELNWRLSVPTSEAPAAPEWATLKGVTKDSKSQAKGHHWVSKGMLYKKSGDLVRQALEAPDAPQVTQKQRKRMITARCKEMANQLAHVIKNGRLFKAFLSAGEAFKVSAALQDKLNLAYAAYFQNPDGQGNLARLEELEDEAAKETEYKTAGGDPEILKALDFHNDMSEGFNMYDICTRKVGDSHCGIYMPGHYWHQVGDRWKFTCKIQWKLYARRTRRPQPI